MEVNYGVHISYFLWSLALGGGLSFLYDMLRSGRRMGKNSVLRVNIEDILFFLLVGILLFLTAYDKNDGRLRWQGFLGTGMGIGIYYLVFRDRIVRMTVFITRKLMDFTFWLIRVLLFPVRVVYHMLAKPFLVITWYSRKSVTRAKGILKTKRERKRMRLRAIKRKKERVTTGG